MKILESQMFRHFIFGRINEFYMYKEYRLQPGQSYKDFRLNMTADYLGIGGRNRVERSLVLYIVYIFETSISLSIILFRFVKSLYFTITTRKERIIGEHVILNVPFQKIKKLFTDAHIPMNSITIVESPYFKKDLFSSGFGRKVSLFSGVSVNEVWRSFLLSCRMTLFIKQKYGYRDCMFRAYSSFDYFLSYFYFHKIDNSNIVYFPSINDRWAYLFGHLENKTVFLQHGGLNKSKVLYIMAKIGKADDAYYINETQRDICNKYMFNDNPRAHYFAAMEFTSNDKLLNNGRIDVMLACELIYFDKEASIIEKIASNPHLNLYVKPHPQNSIVKYLALKDRFDFVLLDKTDFPKMDYLISYDSTLVLEYQTKGVKTLMYEDASFDTDFQNLLSQ